MNLRQAVSRVFQGDQFHGQGPYSVREPQVDMALSVADLVEFGGISMLEAGTGVGKSFAYLIPALLSGQAVVISTATITLQDQLVSRDIPAVERLLGSSFSVAVLKGRSNYLCLRKADLAGVTPEGTAPGAPPAKLAGDAMDCLRSRCPRMTDCHYYRARSLARNASILVVNHHLLLCGLENGDIIPEAWLLVVDEAHALDGAATSTMGYSVSEAMVNGVTDEIALSEAGFETKTDLLRGVGELAELIRKITGTGDDNGEADMLSAAPLLQQAADKAALLRKLAEDHEALAGACRVLSGLERTMLDMACATGDEWCSYVAKAGRYHQLNCVPVNAGALLRERLYGSFPAVLLTSATLSVAGSFSYWDDLLGVPPEAERRAFESPFDYASSAVLGLPDHGTTHDDHEALAGLAWRTASTAAGILGGRTMVLFTSHRNLEICAGLADRDPLQGIEVLVQGRMDRSSILDSFREDPRRIILGTASFWEGIDLPGDLLHALVIDRIPFPSPGHPLTRARMKQSEEQGLSSFSRVMLPGAATRLRQGTGRLIRSDSDWGAVFILDGRITGAGYGGVLLRALAPFRRDTFSGAVSFLREHSPFHRGNTGEGSM